MRLGLYGGTFDPIHSAHIAVAEAAAIEFALSKVLLIPNRIPPHKQDATGASFKQRLRMVELAVAGHPLLDACDIERHEGKSYTIETLESLRSTYGASAHIFFIIGADAFAEAVTWHRAQEVFQLTEFIVAARPGYEYETPAGAFVHRMDSLQFVESSTSMRASLAAGEMPGGLSASVAQYIVSAGLYRKKGLVANE